jgi:hypothetical protein
MGSRPMRPSLRASEIVSKLRVTLLTSRRLGSSSVEGVEEGAASGAVTAMVSSAVGTVAPSVLDGGVATVASFDPASPEDSLVGDAVSLPALMVVETDASGVEPAEREASPWSGMLELVALSASVAVEVGAAGVGLADGEASPWSEVLHLDFSTFSAGELIRFFAFSMSGMDAVYYLPLEEIVKKEWKTLCALGSVRRFKGK